MKSMVKKCLLVTVFIGFFVALIYSLSTRAIGEPFTQASLDSLNKAGKPVLVFVHADWCSTCAVQARVLGELLPQMEFKRIKMLKVDFDQQKEAIRGLGVQYQSTLLAFKNGREVARMTAEKSPEKIADFSLPSVIMIKESTNRAYETTLSEGVRFERRLFQSMFATEDQKEGMSAFVEKRSPQFKNK